MAGQLTGQAPPSGSGAARGRLRPVAPRHGRRVVVAALVVANLVLVLVVLVALGDSARVLKNVLAIAANLAGFVGGPFA